MAPWQLLCSSRPSSKNMPQKQGESGHQWSFLVPLIGGRWYIITQLAIYITYHLLREPETAIDKTRENRDRCFCKIHNWTFQQLPKSCYFGCQFTIFLGLIGTLWKMLVVFSLIFWGSWISELTLFLLKAFWRTVNLLLRTDIKPAYSVGKSLYDCMCDTTCCHSTFVGEYCSIVLLGKAHKGNQQKVEELRAQVWSFWTSTHQAFYSIGCFIILGWSQA